MEKLLSRNKKAYIAFLDLQAAFDTIPREIIWKALQKLGVTKNLLQKIQSIYERVRTGGGQSQEINKMRPIHVQSLIYADDIALIVSNTE